MRWPRPVPVALAPSARSSAAPLRAGSTWPAHSTTLQLTDSMAMAPTHWKVGAIVGGSVFGVLGAGAAWGLCHDEDPCHAPIWPSLGGFVLAGGIGIALGALIGGQFPAGAP